VLKARNPSSRREGREERSLKLRVVSDGVETQEDLEFLQALQCDDAQGYYFSRPVIAEEFAGMPKTGISDTAPFVHHQAFYCDDFWRLTQDFDGTGVKRTSLTPYTERTL
jgi:hypothetical protein